MRDVRCAYGKQHSVVGNYKNSTRTLQVLEQDHQEKDVWTGDITSPLNDTDASSAKVSSSVFIPSL